MDGRVAATAPSSKISVTATNGKDHTNGIRNNDTLTLSFNEGFDPETDKLYFYSTDHLFADKGADYNDYEDMKGLIQTDYEPPIPSYTLKITADKIEAGSAPAFSIANSGRFKITYVVESNYKIAHDEPFFL